MSYLNQGLGFDEVRWATMRKTSYDSAASFHGPPKRELLPKGTRLYRLVNMLTGRYFDQVWWMPESVFLELREDANRASHGGGRLLRNYIAQSMSLPAGTSQLCVVMIELTNAVYAWVGPSAPLFNRPGGVEQIYLPNLYERGDPKYSDHARVVHTYWLRF